MDIAKARSLTDQELVEELGNARRQLYDLRFQLATRQLTDYSQISQTRRTIARLLTVQTERQAPPASGGGGAAGRSGSGGARSRREAAPEVGSSAAGGARASGGTSR